MSGDAPAVRVAAFDVDHTITTRDCVAPFLWRVAGPFALLAGFARQIVPAVQALVARDRNALKSIATMAAFRGRSQVMVEAEAVTFADEVMSRHLRDDTVARLRAHLGDGDVVVLVSASYEAYVRPLGAALGVDDVLATRLEVGDGDRLTGTLCGTNCRGPEKVARLRTWLDAHHGGRANVHLTAYGDSAGDREMLRDADIAHWVDPRSGRRPLRSLRQRLRRGNRGTAHENVDANDLGAGLYRSGAMDDVRGTDELT